VGNLPSIPVYCLLVSVLLSACGFNKSGVVYPELLENTGWKSIPETLQAPGFAGYVDAIRSEVSEARVPFVPGNEADEVQFASPVE